MFDNEQIVENGVVVKILNSEQAQITMVRSSACESCKSMFCNISNEDSKRNQTILDVINTKGAKVGDTVEVTIGGGTILNLAAMVYGIPILIILAVLIAGSYLIPGEHTELISILIAVGLTAIYYVGFWYFTKKVDKKPQLPKIKKIISQG